MNIISQAVTRLRLVEDDDDGIEADFVNIAALHGRPDEAALVRGLATGVSLEL